MDVLLIPRRPQAVQEAAESRRRVYARVASAVRRRFRYAWSRFSESPRQPLAASAVAWLSGLEVAGGVPAVRGEAAASPGLTALCASTLADFGMHDSARRWTTWVLSRQLPEGAFSDTRDNCPSLIDTAQAVQALLAQDGPEFEPAIARACRYLHARIDAQGAIVLDNDGGALEVWGAPGLRLTCLPALLAAAERCGVPAWKQSVGRAVSLCRRTVELTRWSSPSHLFARQLTAMHQLGLIDEVRRALELPAALQDRDGGVPAWPHEKWTSSAGVAQFATLWYQLGERDRADQAMACLHRHQHSDGGFLGSWGRGAYYHPARQLAWTALHALEAAKLQVESSFIAHAGKIEDTIDPWDGRVQAVRSALAELPPGARVADVGCGKGRYLRHFAEWFPHLHFTGIDASQQLLRHLPAGIEPRLGNLHNLPYADGHFDAAFAVESLEHALLPEQAVRELCRIVRPGGRAIIVDKQRSHQPLSEHEPWERWFAPEEVRHWLAAACDRVDVALIAHAHHPRPTGLFLCWTATCSNSKPSGEVSSPVQKAA